MISKQVSFDVRYQVQIFGNTSNTMTKSFLDRKRAQKFFDELPDDYQKSLIMVEETLLDKVY